VLFNEPKLLKSKEDGGGTGKNESFSALQRAEIAEMAGTDGPFPLLSGFSALQRAEIAEIGS